MWKMRVEEQAHFSVLEMASVATLRPFICLQSCIGLVIIFDIQMLKACAISKTKITECLRKVLQEVTYIK